MKCLTILGLLLAGCGKYSPEIKTTSQVDTRSEVDTGVQKVETTTSLDVILIACGVIVILPNGAKKVIPYSQWTNQQECFNLLTAKGLTNE